MATYFDGLKTAQQVKDMYSSLSQILHPDLGGSDAMLAELELQYHGALSALNGSTDSDDSRYEYSKKIESDLTLRLKHLQGLGFPKTVSITINGLWLWVRGDKKNLAGYYPVNSRHDAMLLRAGMTFHPLKGEYYYRNDDAKSLSHGKTASDTIAFKYGASNV